ncbi:MAG: Maf family protein, partial [Pseudohongiellaceae bacterium]
MTETRELLLATASPRRCKLLRQIGVAFRIVGHTVNESRADAESAREFVMRMAREKAVSALTRISSDRRVVVLAADTIVVLGDKVL